MIGSLDDFERPLADLGQRRPQFISGIATTGEDMAQPWEAVADAGKHIEGAIAVLDVGGMDHGTDQKSLRIGDDMALAALGLLDRIIAARPNAFGGFDALAVDHASAGRIVVSKPLSRQS